MDQKNGVRWIEERYQDNMAIKFLSTNTLFSGKSAYQTVEVVETPQFGRVLLNDGIIMITEKDEFIYHDMITHVPLFIHPSPKNILIIGGGDGGTAREVLRHSSVQLCQMVEIDAMVVEACQKYIPQTAQSLTHPKLDLIIEDGVQFIQNTKTKYDVIIVDSTDPIGPAIPLFGEAFYQNVYKALREDGLVVAQGESPFYNLKSQKQLMSIAQKLFPISHLYHFGNMSYPGGLWSFMLASKRYHPIQDVQQEKVEKSKIPFQYYNLDVHKGAFAVPSFLKKEIGLI